MQSDEDLALKQQLELYVERAQDRDPRLRKVALESMRLILFLLDNLTILGSFLYLI